MQVTLIILLLTLMVSTGCSKIEFDRFDPTTSAVRCIMKGEDNE